MEVKVKHDKEVILKGLECWSDSEKDCIKNDSCPYWKEQHSIVGCMYAVLLDIRRLINEQDNEIENLNTLLFGYETGAIQSKNESKGTVPNDSKLMDDVKEDGSNGKYEQNDNE